MLLAAHEAHEQDEGVDRHQGHEEMAEEVCRVHIFQEPVLWLRVVAVSALDLRRLLTAIAIVVHLEDRVVDVLLELDQLRVFRQGLHDLQDVLIDGCFIVIKHIHHHLVPLLRHLFSKFTRNAVDNVITFSRVKLPLVVTLVLNHALRHRPLVGAPDHRILHLIDVLVQVIVEVDDRADRQFLDVLFKCKPVLLRDTFHDFVDPSVLRLLGRVAQDRIADGNAVKTRLVLAARDLRKLMRGHLVQFAFLHANRDSVVHVPEHEEARDRANQRKDEPDPIVIEVCNNVAGQ